MATPGASPSGAQASIQASIDERRQQLFTEARRISDVSRLLAVLWEKLTRNGDTMQQFRTLELLEQVCVIEKNNCNDGVWTELQEHALLVYRKSNNEVHRLLCVSTKSADAPVGHMHPDNFVYFPTTDSKTMGTANPAGMLTLMPDLILKASGESVVKSKLPELALAVRAVDLNLMPLDHLIEPTFSNFFQVATKRTKGNMKVSKIEGIGTETKGKLLDLPTHLEAYDKVENVGELRELIYRVQGNESEKSRLMKALKMNKEVWDSVVNHANKAVNIDNRMRVFTRMATKQPRRDVGLVFACDRGEVQCSQEGLVGYVERQNGFERLVLWDQMQMYAVRQFCLGTLLEEAHSTWAMPDHPGWDIFRPLNMEVRTVDELPIEAGQLSARYPMSVGCAPAYDYSMPWQPPDALDADAHDAVMSAPPPTPPYSGVGAPRGPPAPVRSLEYDRIFGRDDGDAAAPGPSSGAHAREAVSDAFPNIFGGTANDSAFPFDSVLDALAGFIDPPAERGTTRQERGFELPNTSGSFVAPDTRRPRLNNASTELPNDATGPALLAGLSSMSWLRRPGQLDTGPSDLAELGNPPSYGNGTAGRSLTDPSCFHTAPDTLDEDGVRSQVELQQASMDYIRNLNEPEGSGLTNPFFRPSGELP